MGWPCLFVCLLCVCCRSVSAYMISTQLEVDDNLLQSKTVRVIPNTFSLFLLFGVYVLGTFSSGALCWRRAIIPEFEASRLSLFRVNSYIFLSFILCGLVQIFKSPHCYQCRT